MTQTVSQFKILKLLGAGGMGQVYKAEDTKLKRTVALKFVSSDLTEKLEARSRLMQEARAAATLNHANVCTVYEVGEVQPHEDLTLDTGKRLPPGTPFIAMELIDGKPLNRVLSESGPLSIDEFLNVAVQVAEGVSEAHAHGIVHRDLKPQNVIVTSKGLVKILDFGLAKPLTTGDQVVSTEVTTVPLTLEGTLLGTAPYMSPEQATGEEVDSRSDVFSFGVMLYEMVTGKRPFQGRTTSEILAKILGTDPSPLCEARPDLPGDLERIIRRCLRKRPEERYNDTRDLVAALKDLKEATSAEGLQQSPKAETPRFKKNLFKYALPVSMLLLAAVLFVVFNLLRSEIPPEQGLVKLAVLPFENLGSADDEYFADGITDEITSRLAVMPGLAVISRTSARRYKNTDKGLREIGEELDVAYVLEGTIRWDKRGGLEKVRITPQLINVSDDFHLWAENYERDIAEIFAVQADIASQIAEALDITLLESQRQTLEARPTEDLDAYRAYLRGVDLSRQERGGDDKRLGIQMLERAVELDPEFALAYAALSEAHLLMYHLSWDRTEARLSLARRAVEKALDLQPDLPEAHRALALYHYGGYRDYERALKELAIAERGLPNDILILKVRGAIWRRQGKFEAAVDCVEGAFELSPKEAVLASELALTYMYMRKSAEANRYLDLVISLAPDLKWAYGNKAYHYISWLGDTKQARDALEKMPGEGRDVEVRWLELWRYERNYEDILDFVSSDSQSVTSRTALVAARAHRLMGELELAHASYDIARSRLEKELAERPNDHSIHSTLGIAYAGLGRKEEAIREGKRAVAVLPVSKDALAGPRCVWDLAVIYVMVEEYDSAMDEIEYVLSIPFDKTVHNLRLDPDFDPLRDHPRYQELLKKYDGEKIS